MVAEETRALHAYLSVDAHAALHRFADENGVSLTGLMEALGNDLADEMAAGADPMDLRQDWVRYARKIDAQRRRRGGGAR